MLKKLLNKNLKLTKNQKGLTLIELLVVIVILGIIAAIAIPMVTSNQTKANENAAKQTNSIVKDAVNRYNTVEDGTASAIGDLVPNYIADTPTCPEGYVENTDLTEYCKPE